MEGSGFAAALFIYVKFLGIFHTKENPTPNGEIYIRKKVNFYLKEISKTGIQKLIEKGFIKNTNKGYINPKRNQPVGVVRTVHGRHYYIEDFFADMAKKLS